jgi:hypothetical protein
MAMLRALCAALMIAVSGFGRALSVGGRSYAPHHTLGAALVLSGACGALLALRPLAGNVMVGWMDERRRRAGLERDRKFRASRKQFVAARKLHAEHVDHIYRSPNDS